MKWIHGFVSHFLSQFCEWISTPAMCKWAGPIIDLLLEHVAHVQLCSRLTELLGGQEEWLAVKRKSCEHQTKAYHPRHANTSTSLFHILICASNTNRVYRYVSDNPLFVLSAVSPRPLLHLCRLRIRSQIGRHRLKSFTSLPLPDRLIRYLSLADWL